MSKKKKKQSCEKGFAKRKKCDIENNENSFFFFF